MRKFVASVVVVVAGAALVIQAMSSPVGASVSNPGTVTFALDSLSIAIGSTTATYNSAGSTGCSDGVDDGSDTDTLVDFPADPQCTSASDDSEVKAGAQPRVAPKLVGTVTAAGAISVPASGVTLPVFYIENNSAGGDGVVTVTPRASTTATGTITPETGVMQLRLRLLVDLDAANLPSTCTIGSSSTPIDMASLRTTNAGGVAYSTSTGAAKLTDATYAVPGSSGCGLAGGTINSALGIPSAAGNNAAAFALHTTPVLTPGPAPTSSTVAPSTTGGPSTSRPSTTVTTRPPFTWFRTTTTVPRTTSTTRATTTTTRPTTTTTILGPTTTTTTRPWWCTWCR